MNRKHKIFLALLMPFLASILVCCFDSDSVFAHTATLTTSSSVSLDALPSHNGVAIDEESINVTTTCQAGYNLSIATSTSSDLYLNGDGTTTATFTAVDGTSTLANSDNKWGYSLTANASSSTVFSPLSTTASVLKTPSQTASQTDIDDTFSIYYGTKAGSSVTPGSYQMANSGAIVYYLTMEPTCSTVDIAYDGNNADAGTMGAVNTGIIHTGVKDGDEIDLIASNFSKSGYGFAGWSVDPNAGTKLIDNDNTNNPVVYGPQETVTLPNGFADNDTDNDGVVKLYAVWIQTQGNLQGWMGCNNLDTATYDSTTGQLDLTKSSVTALTDQRDNDTYAVARLADGKCWMIENLRLDADATRGNNQTDPTITNEFLAQGYSKYSGTGTNYGDFVGLADPEIDFSYSTTANSIYYSGTQEGTASINIGTSDLPDNRMPRYSNINTPANPTDRPQNPSTNNSTNSISDAGLYSYGNYYTWAAAIADTTYYSINNQSITNTSLCPVGWRLPQGGDKTRIESNDDNDFWNLTVDALNGGVKPANYSDNTAPFYNGVSEASPVANKLKSYPNNYVYSGYFNGSSAGDRGTYAYYWSSTVGAAHNLYLSRLLLYPGTGSHSNFVGRSVRCVASDPETYTLTYDANGGSGVPSSPAPVYSNGFATFTISSTAPTRSGYTFNGWMDKNENEVQPGGTFRTKDPNAVLYAKWTNNSCNPTATTIGTGNASTDAVCLQDVTPSMKANLPIADSTTGTYNLIDARDGQSYTVAKLADGNLWLTKNLNYGSNSDILLASHDTDLPTGKTFKAPASTTDFETVDSTTTRVSPKILTDSTYGGYYSFAAAIASTTAYSTSDQNITTSICPKGWDLPTSAQYDNLRTISGNTTYAKMNAAPYSFIYAGYRNGTSFSSQTSTTRLWTSTNYNAQYAYYTSAYSTSSYNYKRYGESIRCVASNGTATVHYDANGGTGTMADQTGDINSIIIKSNPFTAPVNNQFKNWNTRADGTGTSVTANTPLSAIASNGDNITLYAQWDEIYYIAFDANESSVGATSGSATGTMTNQTVVRNTATAIKTSTFALTGYVFVGWNASADGTGTFYGDEQKVTNLASTGNTITLYAVWMEGALLDTGENAGGKLKKLAGGVADYAYADTAITALVRSGTLPNDFSPSTDNTISDSVSPFPIYAWFDSTDTTIYYYTEATNILMNKDSSYFFCNMRALSDLSTISSWKTNKVANARYMLSQTGLDVSSFTLDLSSWDTHSMTDVSHMFHSVAYNSLSFTLNVSSWDTSNVVNMDNMFVYAGKAATTWTIGNLSSWNTANVTNMSNMFYSAGEAATTWNIGDISSWNTSNVTDMSGMFHSAGEAATTWNIGDISSWNTSSVTTMAGMFYSAGRAATTWNIGNLSSWNTSKVTNMASMFYDAGRKSSSFIFNLSSWDTSNVTSMGQMFSYAGYSATTWSIGNLSSWKTSKVTNMKNMFYYAGFQTSSFVLNLSSWNTSSVTSMSTMFSFSGFHATTWSVTIPKTNNGTATGPIVNTTDKLYGSSTSVSSSPAARRSFTLAN